MKNLLKATAPALGKFLFATVFVAGHAFSSGANAQQAFRCGNTYSETPCAGGKVVDAPDKRTDEQKAQADKVTRDSEKVVKQLASERKTDEQNERAQVRRDKAHQLAEAKKEKIRRTPLPLNGGKKLKPEKPIKPAKVPKSPKPPKTH